MGDEDEEERDEKEEKEKLIPCSKSFKLAIVKHLMAQGPLGSIPTGPKVKKVIKLPRPRGHRPDDTLRYDRVDHWPSYKLTQGRCKYLQDRFHHNLLC